jgi:hypothetical protein
MTHPYRWQHLCFDVPAGVDDDTVVTFREAATRPAFNVTLATAPLSSSTIAAYAQQQEAALRARRPTGYAAEPHRTVDVGGHNAVVCDRRFTDDGGARFVQRQVFVGVAKTVTMVTATSEEKAAPRAFRALDSILTTLRIDDERDDHVGGPR